MAETDNNQDLQSLSNPSEKEDVTPSNNAQQSDEEIRNEQTQTGNTDNDEALNQQDQKKEETTESENNDIQIDYSKYDKQGLLTLMKELLETKPDEELKEYMESIKSNFYKLHKMNIDKQRRDFIKEGGNEADFTPAKDEAEEQFKQLYSDYKEKRNKLNTDIEKEQNDNLQKKKEVIDDIMKLINNEESLNKTFEEFRELQKRWKSIGQVPQSESKSLWNNYHLATTQFYDFIKINKELRDLDLKKNLEEKVDLCEKAEKLIKEPKITRAYKNLQELHDKWREIGPVPKEQREDLWERFREASKHINKKHQEHFIQIREKRKQNLEVKQALLDETEKIGEMEINNIKEWREQSKKIIDIQKKWRATGPVPQKGNDNINRKYKNACDHFFEKKRDFFAKNQEIFEQNRDRKKEFIEKAEQLKDSDAWEKTTKEYIHLQKEWKKTGPAPKGEDKALFKQFKKACDAFFKNKQAHFEQMNADQEGNLKQKEKVIEDIKKFKPGTNVEENISKIKAFQDQWHKIGFVPIKQKDAIQNAYKEAIQSKYDQMQLEDGKKSMLKYKNKLDNIAADNKSDVKLKNERNKLLDQKKKLVEDINVLENNIGFFRNTKNAQELIGQVHKKIDNARNELDLVEEKIKMIDSKDY
jgi:hypothetical protein